MARIRLPVRASAALCWAGLFAMSAGRAGAGEVACRFEAGVITVPAVVGGVAADYILDTGSPITQLHETKARMEG
ncbi:MAG: hypothetical protein KIS90_02660, partial [Phenylobacterium sp.]|nr:hypothetical protein [Phenylobacterium sp.]